VEFSPALYEVSESQGAANFSVVLRTPSALPVTVLFSTEEGTASGVHCIDINVCCVCPYARIFLKLQYRDSRISPSPLLVSSDFTARQNVSVTFLANQTVQTVSVSVRNDQVYEAVEMFRGCLALVQGSMRVVLGVATAAVTISDDDGELGSRVLLRLVTYMMGFCQYL